MRSPSGRWYFRAPPRDAHNVPASDEPLPDYTDGHMPPGCGSEQETAEALAFLSSLHRQKIAEDGTGEFRIVPEEEMIVPLLEAFARAAAQMPALESACLTSRLRAPYFSWLVTYVASRTMAADYEDYLDSDDRRGLDHGFSCMCTTGRCLSKSLVCFAGSRERGMVRTPSSRPSHLWILSKIRTRQRYRPLSRGFRVATQALHKGVCSMYSVIPSSSRGEVMLS